MEVEVPLLNHVANEMLLPVVSSQDGDLTRWVALQAHVPKISTKGTSPWDNQK